MQVLDTGKKAPAWAALLFLLPLLILNILQALVTELGHDEAYYWMYSRFLDLGYFDHPPAIAILIAAGYALIHNELGVRLLSIILSLGALFVTFQMSGRRDVRLFTVLILCTGLISFAGFLALPDAPLFFFTVLFLFVLRDYLRHDTARNAIALSLIIPLMFYSKYHAVLVVGLALLANRDLLRRRSLWMIAGAAFLLFLPHVIWQATHGFPSLVYHLEGRFHESYGQVNALEYLGVLLLQAGPLIGFITLPAAFLMRSRDPFDRTLKYLLGGMILFFLVTTLRGSVQANWISPAYVALLLLSHEKISHHAGMRRWVMRLALPSLLIILVARYHLAYGILELPRDKSAEFRHWKEFTGSITAEAGGLPVVANTYQIASKLSYYTHTMVPSLNAANRSNQFDIWDFERPLQGKDVLFVSEYRLDGSSFMVTPQGDTLFLTRVPHMPLYKHVSLELLAESLQYPPSSRVKVPVIIADTTAPRGAHEWSKTYLSYHIYHRDTVQVWDGERTALVRPVGGVRTQVVNVTVPDAPGKYELEICLVTENFAWWGNSVRRRLTVVETLPVTTAMEEKPLPATLGRPWR